MDKDKEILQLKEKLAYYEKIIYETSAPIIPSVVPDTILVPIAGHLSEHRFSLIYTRVLEYIGEHRDIHCAVIDLTGVGTEHVVEFDYNVLASSIGQLNNSLKLMGIRPIYVGLNPRLVRELVQQGIQVELEAYVNFKTALNQLLKERNRNLYQV